MDGDAQRACALPVDSKRASPVSIHFTYSHIIPISFLNRYLQCILISGDSFKSILR